MKRIDDGMTTAQRYRARNRERVNAMARARYASDPVRARTAQARYQERNPDAVLSQRIRRYGIDAAGYHAMESAQSGVCALCDNGPSTERLFVDHDHRTGRVRALLCRSCNYKVGWLEKLVPGELEKLHRYAKGESS